MLSRRRGQSRLSFAALMSNSASFHPADLPRVSGRRLRSRAPGEGSLTPFSDPSKRELRRGSLISLPRFALSPAPLFPATHLWWLWTGLISVCHWPVRCAWVCARFSREKAVNKMTLLFPLSYHVEKPIMVMLSMSGNLCLSLLSPCPLHSCSYPPPPFLVAVVSQDLTISLDFCADMPRPSASTQLLTLLQLTLLPSNCFLWKG